MKDLFLWRRRGIAWFSWILFLYLGLHLGALAGCAMSGGGASGSRLKTFTSEASAPTGPGPQCKAMLDSYCSFLFSPEVLGNLEIKRSSSTITILRGETANQLPQTFYQYSLAKLKNRKRLPRDFRGILERRGYFEKLAKYLGRKSIDAMSLAERLEVERRGFELRTLWANAFHETVLLRLNRLYPRFYQIPERKMPIELDLERKRARRVLVSEISKALWKENENWRKVERTFEELRESYLRLIDKLDLEPKTRADWTARIKEVKLVLPGSMPAISDEECSTVTANAYYYTYLDVITVCAGDFNSEDILQTLAHEMGHVLGIDRTRYLFETRSRLGIELHDFRKNVCRPRSFNCGQWEAFRSRFGGLLDSLDGYRPELPRTQQCLKRRPTSATLRDEDIRMFATSIVNDRISRLASYDRFLRITKPRIPMRDGRSQKNPNYLDPCSYYLWSQGEEPIDDELTTLMFFTAAYRCSSDPVTERLKSAIETAKTMTLSIVERTLAIEGEFSSRTELESAGFSSPPEERFADVLGSYAVAEYVQRFHHPWERRNKVLAGASWLCREPSLASHFPEESSIEKSYVLDSHSEGEQRKKELFTRPLREAIECQKDFEFNECELPLRSQKVPLPSSR